MNEKEEQLLLAWENSIGHAVTPEQVEEWGEDFKVWLNERGQDNLPGGEKRNPILQRTTSLLGTLRIQKDKCIFWCTETFGPGPLKVLSLQDGHPLEISPSPGVWLAGNYKSLFINYPDEDGPIDHVWESSEKTCGIYLVGLLDGMVARYPFGPEEHPLSPLKN